MTFVEGVVVGADVIHNSAWFEHSHGFADDGFDRIDVFENLKRSNYIDTLIIDRKNSPFVVHYSKIREASLHIITILLFDFQAYRLHSHEAALVKEMPALKADLHDGTTSRVIDATIGKQRL